MIIDCHTHINDGSIEMKALDAADTSEMVDMRIVLGDFGSPAEQINNELEQFVQKHREKAIGFAYFDPTRDSFSLIQQITEKKAFKGIVVYPSECGFHPAHSRAMQLYEKANENNLPVFFHNSFKLSQSACLEYAQPYLLDEIARNLPDLKIIIGSMGYPFIDQTIALIAKHPNIYADLAINMKSVWQVYNTISRTYENGVMDKLLFGSGYPDGQPQHSIETLLGFNKLFADTNLPTVPRGNIRGVVERDSLQVLGITLEG